VALGVTCGTALVTATFTGLYEATPTLSEGLLIAAYALTMIGVCLLACVVPARRALAIEPARALTVER
jgi:ABC-type antimicrobial peptide transport system permease subunit